jgi:hypothetical protein
MKLFIILILSLLPLSDLFAGEKRSPHLISEEQLLELKVLVPNNLKYQKSDPRNNSYFDLRSFFKKQKLPRLSRTQGDLIQEIAEYKKVDPIKLQKLRFFLNDGEAFIDKMIKILKGRPYIFIPEEPEFLTGSDLSHFRSAVKQLNAQALIYYRKKDFEASLNYLRKACFITKKLETNKGAVLDQLVVIACKGITYERIHWILRHRTNSSKMIVELQKVIKSLESPKNVWKDTVKFEMFFSLKMIATTPFDLGPPVTRKELNEFKGELEKVTDKELAEEDVTREEVMKYAADSAELSHMKGLQEIMFRDYLGGSQAFLSDLEQMPFQSHVNLTNHLDRMKDRKNQFLRGFAISPVYITVLQKIVAKKNYRQALLLLVNIRKFENLAKRSPKSLKELVDTKLIEELPKDLWTGEVLSVDFKKRVINFFYYHNDRRKELKF